MQCEIDGEPDIEAELPWMRNYARSIVRCRADAEDIAQDSYLKAKRSKYNGKATLRAWLASIVANTVRDRHRRTVFRKTGDARFMPMSQMPFDREPIYDDWSEVDSRLTAQILASGLPERQAFAATHETYEYVAKYGEHRSSALRHRWAAIKKIKEGLN